MRARILAVTAFVLLAMAIGAAVWLLPHLLVDPHHRLRITAYQRLVAENNARTTIVQALAGAGIVAGLYFSAHTLKLGTDSLKISSDTLSLNRDSEIVERMTKAIEQLGSRKPEVRMGAIYSLERVAQNSAVDHPTSMEILAAFLRTHPAAGVSVVVDVQAAATVIGRRNVRQDPPGWSVDLRRADLRGLDLRDANLDRALLEGAWLDSAKLNGAHLRGARLSGAWLRHAGLEQAHLEGADLTMAHLEGVRLLEAHLEEAHLEGSHIEGGLFMGAHLQGSFWTEVHFDDQTNFDQAETAGAINFLI